MSRSKNLTITLGSLAAGAVLATSITGIAMAADSSPSPSSSSSSSSGASGATDPAGGPAGDGQRGGPRDGGPGRGGMLGAPGTEPLHGEIVVQAEDGTVSTVRMIRGTVTAVSSTSITVKAEDGYSTTFAVDASTTVHSGLRPHGKPGDAAVDTAGSISDVAVGDVADVHGTVSGSSATATRVHSMTAAEAEQAEADRLAHEQEHADRSGSATGSTSSGSDVSGTTLAG